MNFVGEKKIFVRKILEARCDARIIDALRAFSDQTFRIMAADPKITRISPKVSLSLYVSIFLVLSPSLQRGSR